MTLCHFTKQRDAQRMIFRSFIYKQAHLANTISKDAGGIFSLHLSKKKSVVSLSFLILLWS